MNESLLTKIISHFKQHTKAHVVAVIVFLLLENGITLYDSLQNKRAIIGLKFAGNSLTGLSRLEITSIIDKEKKAQNKPLLLTNGSKVYQLSQADIHYSVNEQQLANEILTIGRVGNRS